jgi:hypothetical protein
MTVKSMGLQWAGTVPGMEGVREYKIFGCHGSLSCIIWIQQSVVSSEVEGTSYGTGSVVDLGISYVKCLVVLLRVYRFITKICILD